MAVTEISLVLCCVCIHLSCGDDILMVAALLQQRSDFLLQTSEQ